MEKTKSEKDGLFIRFIGGVEKIANKLPNPFYLFIYLTIFVMILSALLGGITVSYTASSASGELKETTVEIVNLLSTSYLKTAMSKFVSTYTSFSPLGIVMVLMMAIGLAEKVGLFEAFMRRSLLSAPPVLITLMLAFVAVNANVASNAGVVLGATLGAALFSALGRDPILGCLTGYAAAHGGFTACMIPCDTLVSAITKTVCDTMGINEPAHVLFCYYWRFVATITVTLAVLFVSEKIMPKVLKRPGIHADTSVAVTADEKRGLKYALIALIAFVVMLLALTVPKNGFFRAEDGTLLPSSPLMDSINFILFALFMVVGIAYGIGAKKITKSSDVPSLMGEGIRDSISFLVLSLPAALFIQFFNDSKIANVLSVKGAELLKSMGLHGFGLAIGFAALCFICNLFVVSSSAKWLILAPIFVPMLYQMGFTPAFTTAIYTIGDGAANPISPINFYFPIVLGLMNRYKKKEDPEYGIGSLISYMIPYSLAIVVGLLIQLFLWMVLKLPCGPG